MSLLKYSSTLSVFAGIAVLSVLPVTSEAGKPDKPGGGGGATVEYEILQLDSDGGAYSCFANDLNGFGLVVGEANDLGTNGLSAACWVVSAAADGLATSQLHLLPNSNGFLAKSVNSLGEIVGFDPFFGGSSAGLYWPSFTSPPLLLHPLDGDTDAQPKSISDAGIICGTSTCYVSVEDAPDIQVDHPVVWHVTTDENGDAKIKGPFLLPSTQGRAVDVSEPDALGMVTVVGNIVDEGAVAWRFHKDELDTGILLNGPQLVQAGGHALGVNNSGVISGDSGRPEWIATLWTVDDSIDLNLPRKFTSSEATDVNDLGVVVGGVSEQFGPPYEAVIWAASDAKPVLLSSFLTRKSPFDALTFAAAINQTGAIAGAGWDGNNSVQQAFVALPK